MHAHRGRPRAIGLVSGALLALALLAPATGRAACHVKVAELPVRMVGMRAMATVVINGQDVPLFVDTGAFFSFLNEAAAAQLDLATHRQPGLRVQGLVGGVSVKLTTVEHLKLSKGSLTNVDFIVGGNEMGSGSMGLIGRNLLNFADTEYDLAHGMIRFVYPNDECEKTNMAYWADDPGTVASVDLLYDYEREFNRQALRATARLNGKDVDVMFDTGATTTVSLDAAKKAGVKEHDMTPEGDMYGAGRGTARQWTAAFEHFELGGEVINNNRLEVADFDLNDAEMLVGVDFFLSHHVYVSAQQKRMYFTYNGGPVFRLNKAEHASAAAPAAASPEEPLGADAALRRGAASRARGDFAGALADLDHACALAPQNATCFTTRASAHEGLEQKPQALADLDTALRLDPRLGDARIRRAWMLHEDDKDDAVLADAYDERCWARVKLNAALDKALADCDAAIDLDDKASSYFDSRGWVRLRLAQWGKAKSDFDKALAKDSKMTNSLYGRGVALARLGNAGASQADFAAATKLRPDMDHHMRELGLSADQIEGAHP